jgi:ADP-ribose pyrophosphatase YjhB (NUDIX family)
LLSQLFVDLNATSAAIIPADTVRGVTAAQPAERAREIAITVAALAQNGLTYAEGPYDLDRYHKLAALAADLMAIVADRPSAELVLELGRDSGYATPKVDVRGVLFDEAERVLLMRERTDERWSLPGGWADPLDTPSMAVVREIREETGYGAEAVKLAACWDRDVQGHVPPLIVHAYKLFFICRPTGEVAAPDALETLDVGWFALAELPPLSLGRVNERSGSCNRLRLIETQPLRTDPAELIDPTDPTVPARRRS